jgi:hypothetical protein
MLAGQRPTALGSAARFLAGAVKDLAGVPDAWTITSPNPGMKPGGGRRGVRNPLQNPRKNVELA